MRIGSKGVNYTCNLLRPETKKFLEDFKESHDKRDRH